MRHTTPDIDFKSLLPTLDEQSFEKLLDQAIESQNRTIKVLKKTSRDLRKTLNYFNQKRNHHGNRKQAF